MKKLWLLLLAGLLVCTGYAQNEGNIWYFGGNAGLDFNTTPPTPLTGSMSTYEGCASIADPLTGQCLFYTDGITVWGRNHMAMPGSLTTPLNGDPSSTNSGVIVPKPGSNNLYYVFTTAAQVGSYGFPPTMCYSLVDMNLNGGYGDLLSINNTILDSTTEKIAVVGSCDRSVYWIVGHRWNCDTFYAFRLTAAGLEPPVKSKTGIVHRDILGGGGFGESIGYMKFSSDGRKLAAVNYVSQNTLEVFDFDFSTGIVSNPITDAMATDPMDPYAGPYGCSFSPDNTKLYVGWTGESDSWIWQYDMNAGNTAAILASRTIIGHTPPETLVGALQNGPNGKMYVATSGSLLGLGVINNPNALGTACNYVDDGQLLNGGNVPYFGLPAMVESFLSPAGADVFQLPRTRLCSGDTILAPQSGSGQFTITPATGMDVNPDGSLFRFFPTETTTYTVVSTGDCGSSTTSFTIVVTSGPHADFVFNPATPDIGDGNITLLNQSAGAQVYSWYDNDNLMQSHNTNYTFANPGEGEYCYTLVAADATGCTDTARKCITMENGGNAVFIPNTFSPNGDGLNDKFRPYGGQIKLNSFSVFNRYGQRVFYTANIKEGWDGNYKGAVCDMGTYYYLVKYTNRSGQEEVRKGDVTLIR